MVYRRICLTTCLLLCLVIFLPFSSVKGSDKKTLGEIRKELFGKEGIIIGQNLLNKGKYVLFDWYLAKEDGRGGYQKKDEYRNLHAPYSLKGSRSAVVSVQLTESFSQRHKRGTSTDLFGDIVKDDDIEDPIIDLVVKLQDGTWTEPLSLDRSG